MNAFKERQDRSAASYVDINASYGSDQVATHVIFP